MTAGLPDELTVRRTGGRAVGTRFGLRAQLLFALAVLFVLSFSLLAVATVQLTGRSAALEQQRRTEQVAALLARQLERSSGPERESDRQRLLSEAHATLQLSALSWANAGQSPVIVGTPGRGQPARVSLEDGSVLEVWPGAHKPGSAAPLRQLLVFYVALTAGAVLLFAFVLLTFLIVRPLGAVTRSAERLAEGDLSVRVPVSGAAEVATLATSFNRMASQLRREREELEARVSELLGTTRALEATQAQLVHGEKLASVGRLSAGIAHEIGNPLSAILGMVELLQQSGLDPVQQQEFLQRIHAETERINGIIRNLLDFSRRGPATEIELSSVDLTAVVRDALDLVRPQRSARGVTLHSELPAGLPPVRGTAAQLTQVVLNLLLNALDALSGKGEVHLSAAVLDEETLCLRVHDSGPGVSPEVQAHLFEPFTTTKPIGQGTGLGLAVTHGIVERLGGELSLDTSVARGACFVVRLRLAEHASSDLHE